MLNRAQKSYGWKPLDDTKSFETLVVTPIQQIVNLTI